MRVKERVRVRVVMVSMRIVVLPSAVEIDH